jgi:hypothetical protein
MNGLAALAAGPSSLLIPNVVFALCDPMNARNHGQHPEGAGRRRS